MFWNCFVLLFQLSCLKKTWTKKREWSSSCFEIALCYSLSCHAWRRPEWRRDPHLIMFQMFGDWDTTARLTCSLSLTNTSLHLNKRSRSPLGTQKVCWGLHPIIKIFIPALPPPPPPPHLPPRALCSCHHSGRFLYNIHCYILLGFSCLFLTGL